jgi:hypothetical protein
LADELRDVGLFCTHVALVDPFEAGQLGLNRRNLVVVQRGRQLPTVRWMTLSEPLSIRIDRIELQPEPRRDDRTSQLISVEISADVDRRLHSPHAKSANDQHGKRERKARIRDAGRHP